MLLHRRALADLCSCRTVLAPFADLDAAAPARLYTHPIIGANLHSIHEPDAHRNPKTGGQRHIHVDGDAHHNLYTVCHPHPYRYADTDAYRDGDAHRHCDGYRHPYPNTEQHGYQHRHAKPDANCDIDSYANADADRYAGRGSAATAVMTKARKTMQVQGSESLFKRVL